MHRTRPWLAILGAAFALGALAPSTLATDPPIVLRLAIAEGEGGTSDASVRALMGEVERRTGGSVVLQPVWDAGAGTPLGFEEGTAALLVDGGADLALLAIRGLPGAGVSALDALMTPYLITDDALAVAVATGDIAADLLDGMAEDGLEGLAVWPADLGHPVAFESCIAPVTTPQAFEGLTVRAVVNWQMTATIEALGAKTWFVNQWDPYVAACQIQAAESSYHRYLPFAPTVTGDVTFMPRYHLLAANAGALATLTPEERDAIRAAAIATRDGAIATMPGDAESAAEWCATRGRVVLAGPEGVAAFKAAAQPVIARLRADPRTAAAIDRIEALRASTPASPAAVACDPADPNAPATPAADFRGDAVPDGTYRITVGQEELIAAGARPDYARINDATWTLTVSGDTWSGLGQHGSRRERCVGTITSVATPAQRFVTGLPDQCAFDYDLLWRPAPDGIELFVIAVNGDPDYYDMRSEQALMNRVWTRID